MLDETYAERGLTALARAGAYRPMAGHIGAAVLAAYFFCRENALEAGAPEALRRVLDEAKARDRQNWLGPDGDAFAAVFAPYPREPAAPDPTQKITAALETKIDGLCESGHSVIFASLALKALAQRPDLATPPLVDDLCRLLAAFGASPGQGYYGPEKGWIKGVPVDPETHLPPYRDSMDIARAAFAELAGGDRLKRTGYGGLVHLFTHADALVTLDELGHGDLARRGYAAFRTHIMLLRGLPLDLGDDGAEIPLRPAADPPLSRAYWERFDLENPASSALNMGGADHAFKVSYAFYRLIKRLPATEPKDWDLVGYLT